MSDCAEEISELTRSVNILQKELEELKMRVAAIGNELACIKVGHSWRNSPPFKNTQRCAVCGVLRQ